LFKFIKSLYKKFHKTEYDKYNVIQLAGNGHLEVVEYLVTIGAYISADDNYTVRWASENGHLEVVEYLVTVGADISEDDNYAV